MASHTEFITTVNLRNFMHWYTLRIASGAQWEIQQYAKAAMALIKPAFPVAVRCFEELYPPEEH